MLLWAQPGLSRCLLPRLPLHRCPLRRQGRQRTVTCVKIGRCVNVGVHARGENQKADQEAALLRELQRSAKEGCSSEAVAVLLSPLSPVPDQQR